MKVKLLFQEGKVFTISNFITLFRVMLIIPATIIMLFVKEANKASELFTSIVGIAIFSDLIDGSIARLLNQVSPLGRLLDPLADKLCIISAIILLFLKRELPLLFIILIIFREITVFTGAFFMLKKQDKLATSNLNGKIGVVFIGLSIFFYLYDWKISFFDKRILLYIGVIFMYISGFSYIIQLASPEKVIQHNVKRVKKNFNGKKI